MIERITSAERFYYNLQNSRLRDHAFDQWSEYRNRITDLIILNCNRDSTLAVFGAGRCNDIDLGKLSRHFAQVTLIDINEAAMCAALHQYKLMGHPAIKLEVRDFVGISDENYIEYVLALQEEYEQGHSNKKIMRQLDCMYENAKNHYLDFGSKKYDYSIVLNVHSQLNDTADWIRTHMMALMDRHHDYHSAVCERIYGETENIVTKFNNEIFNTTKLKTFIGYEIGINGHNNNGIQGALQTYQDLRKREQNGQIQLIRNDLLTWPYDRKQNIIFSVLLETLSVCR